MKLLKIIIIFFVIYFIRRFIQLYRALKQIKENQSQEYAGTQETRKPNTKDPSGIVDAEYKVIDS